MQFSPEYDSDPSLQEQLRLLAERARDRPRARCQLYDPGTGISAYARHSRRQIGNPSGGWVAFVGDAMVLRTIDCLDIATVEYDGADVTDQKQFARFIGEIYRLNPWGAVCLDNVYNDPLTAWCTENGWKEVPSGNSQHSYYLLAPTGNTIDGAVLAASDAPLGRLALDSGTLDTGELPNA